MASIPERVKVPFCFYAAALIFNLLFKRQIIFYLLAYTACVNLERTKLKEQINCFLSATYKFISLNKYFIFSFFFINRKRGK